MELESRTFCFFITSFKVLLSAWCCIRDNEFLNFFVSFIYVKDWRKWDLLSADKKKKNATRARSGPGQGQEHRTETMSSWMAGTVTWASSKHIYRKLYVTQSQSLNTEIEMRFVLSNALTWPMCKIPTSFCYFKKVVFYFDTEGVDSYRWSSSISCLPLASQSVEISSLLIDACLLFWFNTCSISKNDNRSRQENKKYEEFWY